MSGQWEQLIPLPMYVLDVAFILFGQVHSVLPSEKLCIFYLLVTSAFILLTAVHLLLCQFFGSLFIDVEQTCLFCHSVTAIVQQLL